MIQPLPQADYLRLEHRQRVHDAERRLPHVAAAFKRRRCGAD